MSNNRYHNCYDIHSVMCRTCGSLISCYVSIYKSLLDQGFTIENALNQMNVVNMCCRTCFMSPPKAFFNMIDNDKVRGIESDSIEEPKKVKLNITNQKITIKKSLPKWRPSKFPKEYGYVINEQNPQYELEEDENGMPILHQTYLC